MKAGLSTKILALGLCAALAVNGNVWSFAAEAVGISKEADQNAPATQSEEENGGGDSTQGSTGGESAQTDDGSSDSGQNNESSGSENGGDGTQTDNGSDENSGNETGDGTEGTGDESQTGDGTEGTEDGSQTGDGTEGTGDGNEAGDGTEGTGDGNETGDGTEGTGDGSETGDGTEGTGDGNETGDGSEGEDGAVSDNDPSDENQDEDKNDGSDVSGNDGQDDEKEDVSGNDPSADVSGNDPSGNGVSDNGTLGERRPLATATTEDGIIFSIYADSKDALSTTEDLELTAEKAETDLEGVLELPEEIQILLDAAYDLTLTFNGEEVEINDSIIVGVKGIPEEAENLWALFWDGDELKDAVECRFNMKDTTGTEKEQKEENKEADESLKEEVSLRAAKAAEGENAEEAAKESTDAGTERYFDADALGVIEVLSLIETEEEEYTPAKNFTDAGPFVDPVEFGSGVFARRMAMKAHEEEEAEGVELKKTVREEDGEYFIRLEAYTTGTVTVHNTTVPTDIVLVLDESGSMTQNQMYRYEYTEISYEELNSNSSNEYFVHTGEEYKSLMYSRGWFGEKVGWYYLENEERIYVNKNMSFCIGKKVDIKTRLQALKEAAETFVNIVYENAINDPENPDDNVDHRIALVGFDSYAHYLTGSNSYDALKKVSSDLNEIDSAIDDLYGDGATNIGAGMELTENIFRNAVSNNPNEKRNRVVVLLTDGVPTTFQTFDQNVADKAIEHAKTLKADYNADSNKAGGCTVYTIGIFPGADKDDMKLTETDIPFIGSHVTGGANRFMNLVSSNYKEATDMRTEGFRTEGKDYYLTAGDSEALKDIFENIAGNIEKPAYPLGEDTVIKDTVSDYFKLPVDVDESKVNIYTANYRGNDEDWENVDNWEDQVESNAASVIINDKQLEITGYNFDDHFLSKDAKETDQSDKYGQKLIIEFPIEREDGFIGGNNVPTNDGAGIYSNNEKIKSAADPTVNVPWNYEFATTDRSIYVGDTYADLGDLGENPGVNDFFWKMLQDGVYKTSTDENTATYTPDGTNNAYVNITYTIKDASNNTVAEAMLNQGNPLDKETLKWQLQSDWNISQVTDNQKFTVEVTLSPSEEKASEVGVAVKNETIEKNSNLYVFKPHIDFKDQMIFLGESVDLTETIVEDSEDPANNNMTWECGWTDKDELEKAEKLLIERGTAPELTYEWIPTGTIFGENQDLTKYEPKVDTSFAVNVSRSHTGVDNLTDITLFTHKENVCPMDHDSDCINSGMINEDREGIDFVIHVVSGEITITKQIEKTSLNPNHGDPIFTFRIDRMEGGEVAETFYRTVRFDEGNASESFFAKLKAAVTQTEERTFELSGLPKGEYKVTELPTMRYQLDNVSVGNDTTCENSVDAKSSVTFHIGTPENDSDFSYHAKYGHGKFVNEKINDNSYSDTDVIVNKYKFEGLKIVEDGQDNLKTGTNS